MNVKRSTPVSLEVAVAEREYIIVEARELVTGSEPRYGEGPHRIITDGTSEPVFKALSRPVQPLEEDPALHRNFADLGENDQAFADFASRYGLLHGGLEVRLEVPGKTVNDRPLVSLGEPIEAWRKEVDAMQRCVKLWDWTQDEDYEQLNRFFSSHDFEFPPAVEAALHTDNPRRPAMYLIEVDINERLRKEPIARFSENGRKTPAPSLTWAIKSLRTGIWFMMARDIFDGRKYKSCAQCGKWFEVKTGTRRTTRIYCSNACRTRAHRERQDEARRLHAKGRSLREIAKELDADPEIVEKWLAVNRKG